MEQKKRKYYWLKLKRDFFKRHDIRIIEDMDNGKDYILFYLKLLVESIDHDGHLRFSDTIPYNDRMLSTITNTNIDVVRAAMKIFTELRFIDVLDDETIYMKQIQEMTGVETAWALKKRLQREKEGQQGDNVPLMSPECPQSEGTMSSIKGTMSDKSIEKEYRDIEKDINTDEPESTLPALTPTAEPKGSVSKQTKSVKIPEADLPLYNNVKKYYEEQQDSKQFTNYPKEATAIKGLIEKSKIQAPDNHVEFLKMLTSVFKELRNIDPFYGKHPFLPSSLNSSGIFDRVLNEAQMKWKEKQEASAFDVSELY